jgi:hypothetical protein
MNDMKKGGAQGEHNNLSPANVVQSLRRRGWVWTRFYLVPPPPPSFGNDASGWVWGFFILFFPDEGRVKVESIQLVVAFKKQCLLHGPQVFFHFAGYQN